MRRFLSLGFPYLLFAAMAIFVVAANWGAHSTGRGAHAAMDPGGAVKDPVCGMEVSASRARTRIHEGHAYSFCSDNCLEKFDADPLAYLGEKCPVCGTPVDPATALTATYMGHTYHLDSAEHRARFKADPARYFMHTMWGIPPWLYYLSIAGVLVVSFFRFEGLSAVGLGSAGSGTASPPEPPAPPRFDLMVFGPVRWAVRSRGFRSGIRLVMAGAFVAILWAGLFGNQNPALNLAPLLTWTIWWCGLVIVLLFAGKTWCYLCPWDAIATWMERLTLWKKTDRGLGLGLPWPRKMRNIWLATVLFVGLTWIELGFRVTTRPAATAWMGIGMLVLTIVSAYLFEKKSFCRYGCLVGRVSGLYALFSGVEVRSRDKTVCRTCEGKQCVRGSPTAYGCPTFENPSRMAVNTYCIQCTECFQACPHDNLALNLRPWGSDLATEGRPSTDEAYLALLMLAITSFHGLTMTPAWPSLLTWLESTVGLGKAWAFTVGMTALMCLPVVVFAALIRWSHAIAAGRDPGGAGSVPYHGYFVRYAYCVLPIALFYHLAHNIEHLFSEGPKIVRLVSDPLGRGWNLFGTATWSVPPLASLDTLWVLQVVLVGVGHVYSLWAAQKISRRTFSDPRAAARGQLPILVGMIAFSIFSLWLLKQPMQMRTSAM